MEQQLYTNIEALVLQYLINHQIPFTFQSSLAGGYYSLGGAVVDFLVEPNLAWRVMGEYYHKGAEKTGSDLIQKETLIGLGYIVVDLLGDDLLDSARLEQTMRLALQGQEMLR